MKSIYYQQEEKKRTHLKCVCKKRNHVVNNIIVMQRYCLFTFFIYAENLYGTMKLLLLNING